MFVAWPVHEVGDKSVCILKLGVRASKVKQNGNGDLRDWVTLSTNGSSDSSRGGSVGFLYHKGHFLCSSGSKGEGGCDEGVFYVVAQVGEIPRLIQLNSEQKVLKDPYLTVSQHEIVLSLGKVAVVHAYHTFLDLLPPHHYYSCFAVGASGLAELLTGVDADSHEPGLGFSDLAVYITTVE